MRYRTRLFICSPFLLALTAAYFKSLWLTLATVILMFLVVAVLPFARKRENLWLFILWAGCSIPINFFLLCEYPYWREWVFNGDTGLLNILSVIEMILVCTGVEEVILAYIGRMIWKRQYVLMLPEAEEKKIENKGEK